MNKDYYKILGVTEFDTAENIKTAYRKLARKFHPDIAGNSKDVILKFKEINEAYEILSNKIKKEEYDKAKRFYDYAKKDKTTTNESFASKVNENQKNENDYFKTIWENFINKKENNREKDYNKTENGKDLYSDIEISVFEAISGATKILNMLQTQTCPSCKGKKFINNSNCSHCKGKGEITSYKKFNIKIPAGIKNNSKIRLAGEGLKGKNGGKNGDLYIKIHVKEQENYKTEGLNILKTIPITPAEAVLGTIIKINTLNGVNSFKIQPNTQNGQKIRLANCGIVQNNKIGDMIITVEIKIPENLTQEEIELYKKLEEISKENIRKNI